MKLILVRHGETVANVKGIIQGQMHGQLTKEGQMQAKRVAKRLKTQKIDHIYASDLKRARMTGREIAKYHKHVPFTITKDVRERHYGEQEGKYRHKVGFVEPKKGETLAQLRKRAVKTLDTLLHKHKNDTVLVVSHGTFGRALIAVIRNEPVSAFWKAVALKNTSVSIFSIREDKNHKVHLFNSTKHLD